MGGNIIKQLTERQSQVLKRIDLRIPIKVIADEMGVSETRINQHIRVLKNRFGAENLNGLVESFRAEKARNDDLRGRGAEEAPYRKTEYRNSQLDEVGQTPDVLERVVPGEINQAEAHHVLIDAPRQETREPVVVPKMFDGKYAVLYRIMAIVGIAMGAVAALILVVVAALSLGSVLEGKAAISSDNVAHQE